MARKRRMKYPFRRFRKTRRRPQEDVDLNALAAMVHLIDHAEPDPDMLRDIEAAIDLETDAAPPMSGARTGGTLRMVMILVLGLALGMAGALLGQSRQHIIARPSATSPWVSLGSVILKGPTLRSFVRAKCEGQTHFFVTMHGFNEEKTNETNAKGPTLMAEGEKILIECIF